jgi:predicted metalloprotease with PDZ domain
VITHGNTGARPWAIALLGWLVAAPLPAVAQQYRIAYTIGMPDIAAHLYAITLAVSGLGGSRPVELQMPVWSPGRYGRMDFAKNVQDFSAVGSDGKPLRWDRVNGSLWRVLPGASRSVRATYRVFADAPMSGTFSVLDSAHANWNGASLLMYVEGHKQDPVSLTVEPPEGWTIMNGAVTQPGQRQFQFPNYDLLIDTPTEVAPAGSLLLDSFVVDDRKYRVMVHHSGPAPPPAGARERFVHDVERIVRYENSVFGAPPLEQYTFLFNIGFPGGDGMEHLYSTQIQNSRVWTDTATLLPGISSAAHEYFHVWNVKRVRPAALGPFDYTREQYEPSLWVAEGWTQYYGQAALRRAGLQDTGTFYARMASLIRANLTAPGRKEVSARVASFEAPFWDGAPQAQPTNFENTFFDYYTKGAGIATCLDLFIRHQTGNTKSLDDAFNDLKHRVWDAPKASYYLQGRGYTEDDVEQAVSAAAGTDMHTWFAQHVGGTDDMDYDAALSWAGLKLLRAESGQWQIEEMPDATPEQLKIRNGWLTGQVDR